MTVVWRLQDTQGYFKPVDGGIIGVCEVNGTYQRCVEPEINGSCAPGLQSDFQNRFLERLAVIRTIKMHCPMRERADSNILKTHQSVSNTRALTSMNV